MATIDERVTSLLTFVQQQARRNIDVVFGDGAERSRDTPETRMFCRQIAAEGIVLLKNEGDILPLVRTKPLNIAVIGPNVKERVISGGGSAALKPTYVVTPWDGITEGAPADSMIHYHIGCYGVCNNLVHLGLTYISDVIGHKYLPTLENNLKTPRGDPGWLCTFFAHDEHGGISYPVQQFILNDTRVKLNDFLPQGLTPTWSIKLEGKLAIDKTCLFEFGLTVAGILVHDLSVTSPYQWFHRPRKTLDRWLAPYRQLVEANPWRFFLWVRLNMLLFG